MPAVADSIPPRPPEPPVAGVGAWLKTISQNIASIALILTTLVGLPSLLFTWSNQSTERFKAFNTAVEREEERWRGLYQQYFAALADKSDADAADKPGKAIVADAKFRALCLFATPKQFPDFHEFRLGFWQPAMQVNYPNDHDYTRIVEIKHATGQKLPVTTIVREYPADFGPGQTCPASASPISGIVGGAAGHSPLWLTRLLRPHARRCGPRHDRQIHRDLGDRADGGAKGGAASGGSAPLKRWPFFLPTSYCSVRLSSGAERAPNSA